jgi:hypothetical protein
MAFKFTPKYIQIWLLISSLVVIYDAAYVLLRPDSMKGGSLFKYFFPYELYIQVDTLYGDIHDKFGIIQSWLNLV